MRFPTFLEEAQHFEARKARKDASADPMLSRGWPSRSAGWPVGGANGGGADQKRTRVTVTAKV